MTRPPLEPHGPRRSTLIVQPLPGIGDMVWHLPHIYRIARSSTDSGDHPYQTALARGQAARRRPLRGQGPLVGTLAGIPERIGYGRGAQRWLLNHPLQLPAEELRGHPIEMADRLLAHHGLPEREHDARLPVAPDARALIEQRFADLPRPWIALGLGSSEAFRQWGEARFSELSLALRRPGARTLFLLGGPAEENSLRAVVWSAPPDCPSTRRPACSPSARFMPATTRDISTWRPHCPYLR